MTLLRRASEPPATRCTSSRTTSALDYHNDGHTHIDALCHVAYKGLMYNGKPEDAVDRRTGATVNTIEVLRDGLVGRAVLLDIPRAAWGLVARARRARVRRRPRGRRARAGRRGARRATSCSCERAIRCGWPSWVRGTRPRPRPGCTRRRCDSSLSAGWPCSGQTATTTPRRAAPRASTSRSTCSRSARWASTCSTTFSSRICARCASGSGRWEFLFAAAPLRIIGGTGSPLNPVAVF